MKKGYSKSNIKFLKFFDQNDLGSLPRILLSSGFIVMFFYFIPAIIDFTDKRIFNTNEFQNNSKAILAYTLNEKKNGIQDNGVILDERELLVDILSLNDLEVDTVRLNASTIKQL